MKQKRQLIDHWVASRGPFLRFLFHFRDKSFFVMTGATLVRFCLPPCLMTRSYKDFRCGDDSNLERCGTKRRCDSCLSSVSSHPSVRPCIWICKCLSSLIWNIFLNLTPPCRAHALRSFLRGKYVEVVVGAFSNTPPSTEMSCHKAFSTAYFVAELIVGPSHFLTCGFGA